MKPFLLLFAIATLFCSCDSFMGGVSGRTYVPVYSTPTDIKNIGTEVPKTMEKPGKIYASGNLLFQNDVNKGVHIINISNAASPQKISFLRVPYSTEISVKGNYLYVNNFNDLLVFDIANPVSPVLKKRLENVFSYPNDEYPPVSNVYFECVDPSKGIVVGWEIKEITDPKCRR